MTIPDEAAAQAAHAAICEQNFDDCLEWRGRCVKAVEAAAPRMLADLAKKADECTADDMDNYFIDQADVGGWLRSLANPDRSHP